MFCDGECTSDSADFDLAYHSVNQDTIQVQFGWCAYDTSNDCSWSYEGTSSTNLAQHFSDSYTNNKYKQNSPQIQLTCQNTFEDCQIELAGMTMTCQ